VASKKYKFDPEKLKSDIKAGFKSSQTDYSKKPTSNSKTSSNKTNTKKQVIGNDALSRNNPAFAYLQNEGGGKKIIKGSDAVSLGKVSNERKPGQINALGAGDYGASKSTRFDKVINAAISGTASAYKKAAADVMSPTGNLSMGESARAAIGEAKTAKKEGRQVKPGQAQRKAEQEKIKSFNDGWAGDFKQKLLESAEESSKRAYEYEQEAKEGLGKFGQGVVDFGIAGAQFAGDALLNAVAPGTGLAAMAGRAYGSASLDAQQRGLSEGEQQISGLKNAAIEMLTEKLFGSVSKVAYGKGIIRNESLVNSLVNRLAKTDRGRTALKVLVGANEEGLEEVLSDILNPIADRILKLDDGKGDWSDLADDYDTQQMLEDYIIGGALGLVGAGTNVVSGQYRAENAQQRAYEEYQRQLVNAGLATEQGGDAQLTAEKYKSILDQSTQRGKRNLSDKETENLERLMTIGTDTQTVRDMLAQSGVLVDDNTAQAAALAASGQKLSSTQNAAIGNAAVQDAINQMAGNGVVDNIRRTAANEYSKPIVINSMARQYEVAPEVVERTYNLNPTAPQAFETAFNAVYQMGQQGTDKAALGKVPVLSTAQANIAYQMGADSVMSTETAAPVTNNNTQEVNDNGVRIHNVAERINGQNTEGQIRGVETGTGENVAGGSQKEQGGTGAAQIKAGEKVSYKGKQQKGVYYATEDTEDMKKGRKLAESYGYKVMYFVGGNIRYAGGEFRGVVDTANKTVMVRADHPDYTAEQIMRHEMGHAAFENGDLSLNEAKEMLLDDFTEDELNELIEIYSSEYGDILSAEEAFEEICCDALGRMNIFEGTDLNSESYGKAQYTVRKYAADKAGSKGRAPPKGGEMYSREVNGKKIAWIENNPLSLKDLTNYKKVAAYIADHIGEVYTILESGSKVYIGENLPSEYTQSEYTRALLRKSPKTLTAKNKAIGSFGEMIEIAANRRWEKTKHIANKDAKYGVYRYSTAFAFPVKQNNKITNIKSFDAELVILNSSDGKKYLYDIVNIKENTADELDLMKRDQIGGQDAPARRGASKNSIRSSSENVNKKFSLEPVSDSAYMEAVDRGDIEKAQRMVDEAALKWGAMKNGYDGSYYFYHGTNSDNFNVFDKSYIGAANDSGFFGKGFYFAYSRGEASYYGRNVKKAYLRITKPFDFQQEMYMLDGKRSPGRADIAFIVNFTNKFPELAEKHSVSYVEKGSDNVKTMPYAEFSELFIKYYNSVDFKVEKLENTDNEFAVLADKYTQTYEGVDGKKHKFTDYKFNQRVYGQDAANDKVMLTMKYIEKVVFDYVDTGTSNIGGVASVIMESPEFSSKLRKLGYDGVIQSKDGDEAVVFDSEQIKAADPITYDDNGNIIPLSKRFDSENEDIRYSREPERLNELRRQNERKLAQATAEDAANENERGLIRDYQKQYSKVEDIREKLSAAQQALTEAEDSGADYDTTTKAKNRFTVLSNQYAREHRKLESYAKMKALQNVLTRVDERLGNDLPEGMGAASANFTGEETVGERWVTEAQGEGDSALHPISKEQEANLAEQQHRAPQEIPKKDLNGKLTSKHVSTIANSGMTPAEFSDALREDAAQGKFSHIAYSDEEALKKAERAISEDGWDQALANYKAEINSGRVSKDNTVMGIALYNNAVNSGDYVTAMDIASLMVKNSTNTAQSLQAMRILNKLSPECRLYLAAKSIENIEEDLNERYKDNKADIHVDKILYDEYAKALRQSDEDGIKTAWANIEQSVAQQIDATWYEKLNNFRYLAMLGNPRTHVRNIVGNAFFVPVRAVKNTIAYGLENIADAKINGGIERSKAILNSSNAADAALVKYAMSDYEAVQEVILSGGKYVDTFQGIDKHRTIYKTKILEAARKGNSAALDAEDAWFCKPAYANALAKWYKANGISAEQLNTGKVPEETIIKAQTIAIKEAQKATYRDTNWFSAQVSRLGKVDNKVAAVLIEGVLPFKKTPANILARAVEYSPVGLIKSLALDTKKVKAYVNGDIENGMSPAEFIDDISAGLTGSALMGLGILLASWGVLSGGDDDDEKQNYFDELSGKQNYALSIGGMSITLDWLAPESMPLFVGVELFNSLSSKNEDKGFLQNLMSSVMSLSTPMFEMSMLQSVNDLFDNLAYIKQGQGTFKIVSSMAANYISQYFPTLFGQTERSFEEAQRETTYIDRNSKVGSELQYMWGKIANKIPFYDFSQIPYIDAWGRTEETGNLFERMLNNFINPAYVKKERPTEIDGELERLYDLGETSVYPSRAKTNTKINGEYLTADEYVKYATTKGQTSYELAQGVINSAAYSGAADPEKAYMLKYVYSYADHIAKYEVNNDYSLAKWEMAAYKSANPMQAIIDHAREYYNPDKEN
jgi:hypothetical protein